MLGWLIFGSVFAFFAILAARDVAITRQRRRAWQQRLERADAPRRDPRWSYLSASGYFYALDEVSAAELRQKIKETPAIGFPVFCARDEDGHWLLWPGPAMRGEVVQTLCAVPAPLRVVSRDGQPAAWRGPSLH